MNKLFLTLFACMLISANARFFRGGDLLQQGVDFLKSVNILQNSADFQGDAHYEHTHGGDVEHRAAAAGMTTEAHITSEIAINLGAKMPGYIAQVREILETQVDTGVTFCGHPYTRTSGAGHGQKLSEIIGNDPFSAEHAYSDSAVSFDGVVAKDSQISLADDINQCGPSDCVSGSIVYSVAQFIRAQGYHINHADICRARGTQVDITSQTCNLVTSPSLVKQFNCKKKTGFSDQWKYDRECAAFGVNYRVNNDGTVNTDYGNPAGSSPCDATTGGAANCIENDDTCIYDPVKVAALDGGNLCVEDVDNAVVPSPCSYLSAGAGLTDANGAACTPVMNQLKRTLKYGLIEGNGAEIPDSTVVTGAADGCTSLRGIVLAINGNKLERTYVSKQHDAAEDYWQGQIDDTKSIVKTIRAKIINLQGLDNFFYPLEKSKKYECDSEFGAFEQGIDAGGAENPKCDLAGTDYSSFQGTPHTKSMAQRTSCFCRSFADSGDEFYLTTTQSTGKAFCDANFKEKLPSVYSYCLNHAQLGETDEWKRSLDELLFSPNDIPTNLDTWFHGASVQIKKNFEDSIVGQGTRCGRVSTADPASVKFSNKGGNCIPLDGVQDIVYRLEFEYFDADAAVDRKGAGNTYADIMCVANPGGDQVLSFRQLAYVWQRMGAVTANQLPAETDVNGDTIGVNNARAQLYDDDGTNDYQDFCSVDYAQMLGGGKAYKDAGMNVADPLDFLGRVNSEASQNVEATANAKNAAKESEDRLWSKLSDELTLDQEGRIIKSIGDRAAAHFKRINSHAMDGHVIENLPLCKQNIVLGANSIEQHAFDSCADIKSFAVAPNVGVTAATKLTIDKWAFYGAKNLDTITLPGQVTVGEMAFRNIGGTNADPKTINFASNIYAGDGANAIALDFHALSSPTQCGVTCDDDYKASVAASHNLCDLHGNQAALNAASCDFDNDVFDEVDNTAKTKFLHSARGYLAAGTTTYNDGTASRFLSKSIDKSTKIEAKGSSTGLRLIDLKLPAGCGKLTVGDFSAATELTHVYIERDAACALTQVDLSAAKLPASLQLLWSNDQALIDAFKAEATFDGHAELSFGVGNVIEHFGGARVTDGEMCAEEVVLPNAVNALTQLAKLPFGTQPGATEQLAQAVYNCVVAAGTNNTARQCAAADATAATQGHSGFVCTIQGGGTSVQCTGGQMSAYSKNIPDIAIKHVFDATKDATCAAKTDATAASVVNDGCAFDGKIVGLIAAPTGVVALDFRCVGPNAHNNATVDRDCDAADVTLAETSHFGLQCKSLDNVHDKCVNWNGDDVLTPQNTRTSNKASCESLANVPKNFHTVATPAQAECRQGDKADFEKATLVSGVTTAAACALDANTPNSTYTAFAPANDLCRDSNTKATLTPVNCEDALGNDKSSTYLTQQTCTAAQDIKNTFVQMPTADGCYNGTDAATDTLLGAPNVNGTCATGTLILKDSQNTCKKPGAATIFATGATGASVNQTTCQDKSVQVNNVWTDSKTWCQAGANRTWVEQGDDTAAKCTKIDGNDFAIAKNAAATVCELPHIRNKFFLAGQERQATCRQPNRHVKTSDLYQDLCAKDSNTPDNVFTAAKPLVNECTMGNNTKDLVATANNAACVAATPANVFTAGVPLGDECRDWNNTLVAAGTTNASCLADANTPQNVHVPADPVNDECLDGGNRNINAANQTDCVTTKTVDNTYTPATPALDTCKLGNGTDITTYSQAQCAANQLPNIAYNAPDPAQDECIIIATNQVVTPHPTKDACQQSTKHTWKDAGDDTAATCTLADGSAAAAADFEQGDSKADCDALAIQNKWVEAGETTAATCTTPWNTVVTINKGDPKSVCDGKTVANSWTVAGGRTAATCTKADGTTKVASFTMGGADQAGDNAKCQLMANRLANTFTEAGATQNAKCVRVDKTDAPGFVAGGANKGEDDTKCQSLRINNVFVAAGGELYPAYDECRINGNKNNLETDFTNLATCVAKTPAANLNKFTADSPLTNECKDGAGGDLSQHNKNNNTCLSNKPAVAYTLPVPAPGAECKDEDGFVHTYANASQCTAAADAANTFVQMPRAPGCYNKSTASTAANRISAITYCKTKATTPQDVTQQFSTQHACEHGQLPNVFVGSPAQAGCYNGLTVSSGLNVTMGNNNTCPKGTHPIPKDAESSCTKPNGHIQPSAPGHLVTAATCNAVGNKLNHTWVPQGECANTQTHKKLVGDDNTCTQADGNRQDIHTHPTEVASQAACDAITNRIKNSWTAVGATTAANCTLVTGHAATFAQDGTQAACTKLQPANKFTAQGATVAENCLLTNGTKLLTGALVTEATCEAPANSAKKNVHVDAGSEGNGAATCTKNDGTKVASFALNKADQASDNAKCQTFKLANQFTAPVPNYHKCETSQGATVVLELDKQTEAECLSDANTPDNTFTAADPVADQCVRGWKDANSNFIEVTGANTAAVCTGLNHIAVNTFTPAVPLVNTCKDVDGNDLAAFAANATYCVANTPAGNLNNYIASSMLCQDARNASVNIAAAGSLTQAACVDPVNSPHKNVFTAAGATPAVCTRPDETKVQNFPVLGTEFGDCKIAANTLQNVFYAAGSRSPAQCIRDNNINEPTFAAGKANQAGNNATCQGLALQNVFTHAGETTKMACTRPDLALEPIWLQLTDALCQEEANRLANTYTAVVVHDDKIECDKPVGAPGAAFDFDVSGTGAQLDLASSTPWIPAKLAAKSGGKQRYLVSSGATLSGDQLSKVCPKTTEVMLPNSVTKLGVGFVVNLNTEQGVDLDVYVGDSVSVAAPAVSIDQSANILPNDVSKVAAFFRRCPSDGTRKYQFDNLSPRDANGAMERDATTNLAATRLNTMNDMEARNLENGVVDTCLN